ncbi:hypothetical protein SDC9_112056 [bioreactor metagenome]|uniref:Uncharacterized protein n=1 Tax=bioreactor metagenome TaxID=1076179 RepID=A0A645BTN2_9ZZZZ
MQIQPVALDDAVDQTGDLVGAEHGRRRRGPRVTGGAGRCRSGPTRVRSGRACHERHQQTCAEQPVTDTSWCGHTTVTSIRSWSGMRAVLQWDQQASRRRAGP